MYPNLRQAGEHMRLPQRLIGFVLAITFMCANSTFSDSTTSPSSNTTMLTIETIKRNCIEFSGIKIGSESDEAADCRVSEFGSMGIFNNQTYYYATYCLIPGYSIQNGRCGSDSFNAQYYKEQAMAIFVNKSLSIVDPNFQTTN